MSVRAAVKKYGIVGDAAGDLTRRVLSCPVFDLSAIFPITEAAMKANFLGSDPTLESQERLAMSGFISSPGPPPFCVCLLELGVNLGGTIAVLELDDRFIGLVAIAGHSVVPAIAILRKRGVDTVFYVCPWGGDGEVNSMAADAFYTFEKVARQIINDRKRVSVTRVDRPRRKATTKGERSDVVYHVVKLKAGRTPERYGKLLARAERMAARQHQVRGHWKYNGTKWIESYKRGRGGIVEKDYRVE